ncbi:MAG: hypothetical protein ACR2O6_04245 [Ilumatobacteraceae bacterium]
MTANTAKPATTETPARTRRTTTRAAFAAVAAFAVIASACSTSTEQQASGPDVAFEQEATSPDPSTPASADDAADADPDQPAEEPAETGDVPTGDEAEDANDLLDDSDDQPDPEPPAPQPDPPDAEDDADNPVDLDPVPQPEAEPHPCDSLTPDGSSLVVGPDPLVLDDGDLDGSLFIVNCSDGDIDWTAATKPSVSLDDDGANLLPGEFAELDFDIDADAWDPGAIDFKIKVSEPGHNHYIDIHAFRPLVGSDVVAGNGTLTAGQGAGGCNNQCIQSALLVPNFTSPNLGLDITTNTPAKIRTWVSTQGPVFNDDVPSFPGVAPIDTSLPGATQHHAVLSPLQAGTDYHIIVSATDEFDHTSYRVGEFTTITPVDNPGDFVLPGDPPGCSNQCITKAHLTAGDDFSEKHLSIASHTAAQFQVSIADEAPVWNDGIPGFADTDLWVPSGLEFITEWETDLVPLEASTTYHIVVRAEDAFGNVDYRAGQFQTAAAPTYDVIFTNLGIDVDYDGDKNANRGELRFAWRVGDGHAGNRSEDKISSGDRVHFSASNSTFVAHDVVEFVPTVFVAGFERDPDGKVEFCTMGTGTPSDNGSNDDCDVVWSVAASGIYTLDSLTGLPTCAGLGYDAAFDGHLCMTLTTGDTNGGRPEFTSHVAVQVTG